MRANNLVPSKILRFCVRMRYKCTKTDFSLWFRVEIFLIQYPDDVVIVFHRQARFHMFFKPFDILPIPPQVNNYECFV